MRAGWHHICGQIPGSEAPAYHAFGRIYGQLTDEPPTKEARDKGLQGTFQAIVIKGVIIGAKDFSPEKCPWLPVVASLQPGICP